MEASGTAYAEEAPSDTSFVQEPADGRASGYSADGLPANTAEIAENESLQTETGQDDPVLTIGPRPRKSKSGDLAFHRLEQREGVVLAVDMSDRTFTARLVDPAARHDDEHVVIDLEQISPTDFDLVEPGALFYWAIGYVTRRTGRRNLVLALDFRRLPLAHRNVRRRAEAAADQFRTEMGWT